jgi:uncharacterized protein (TIGR03382 family)
MLGSVSKRMAGEFFGNVAEAIGGGPVAAATPAGAEPTTSETSAAAQVFTAPPRAASSQPDFLKGVGVGAALVLLGVILGRRRR